MKADKKYTDTDADFARGEVVSGTVVGFTRIPFTGGTASLPPTMLPGATP